MQILPAPVSWRRALAARMGFLFSMTSPEPAAATPSPAEVSGRRFSPAAGGRACLICGVIDISTRVLLQEDIPGSRGRGCLICRVLLQESLPAMTPIICRSRGEAVSEAYLFLRITMCEVLGFPWTSRNYMQFLMANFNSVYIPQHITSNAKQP